MKNKRKTEVYYTVFSKQAHGLTAAAYEILDSFKSSVVIIFLIFLLVIRVVGVVGESMVPTLNDGDKVVITSRPYNPERGDIVILAQPWERDNSLVKRVIGVAGDTVDIDFVNGYVYINGEKQTEDYIKEPTHINYDVKFPVTVPDGCIFVMGDNRNESLDSRSSRVGFIDKNYVLGKAVFRLNPDAKKL